MNFKINKYHFTYILNLKYQINNYILKNTKNKNNKIKWNSNSNKKINNKYKKMKCKSKFKYQKVKCNSNSKNKINNKYKIKN